MRDGLRAAFRIASMVKELRGIEHPKGQESLSMRVKRVPASDWSLKRPVQRTDRSKNSLGYPGSGALRRKSTPRAIGVP